MDARGAESFGKLRRFALELSFVAALLIAISLTIRALDLDLTLARGLLVSASPAVFWARERALWDLVYRWGVWPANVVGILALLGLLASWRRASLRRHRRSMLALILVLALGPGVLVNMVFKEHWGRPRPREITALGGSEPFLPVGEPGVPGRGESFPSGHAAMGFYFATFYVLLRKSHPERARLALAGSAVAGGVLGFQRMAVGAHFLSDVLWAGGVVYLTALVVDAILPDAFPPRGRRRSLLLALGGSTGLATLLLALTGMPYDRTMRWRVGSLEPGSLVTVSADPAGADRDGTSGIAAGADREGTSRIAAGAVDQEGTSRIAAAGEVLWVEARLRGYTSYDADFLASLETRTSGDTVHCIVHWRRTGLVNRIRPVIEIGVERAGAARE